MLEVTVAAGGSNGRKAKDLLATHHEEAGFPASTARSFVLRAAGYIGMHIDRAGASPALNLAIETLELAAGYIEDWRTADQKRGPNSYPYQRKPVGHA